MQIPLDTLGEIMLASWGAYHGLACSCHALAAIAREHADEHARACALTVQWRDRVNLQSSSFGGCGVDFSVDVLPNGVIHGRVVAPRIGKADDVINYRFGAPTSGFVNDKEFRLTDRAFLTTAQHAMSDMAVMFGTGECVKIFPGSGIFPTVTKNNNVYYILECDYSVKTFAELDAYLDTVVARDWSAVLAGLTAILSNPQRPCIDHVVSSNSLLPGTSFHDAAAWRASIAAAMIGISGSASDSGR